MNTYVVLYREDPLLPADPPLAFVCEADDNDHAEEQCVNAYPDCRVVWTYLGRSVDDAFRDYWGTRL